MSEAKILKSGEVVVSSRMVEVKAVGFKKILIGLKLMRRWRNPDHRAALISAISRAGKVGLAGGVAFGLISFFSVLEADQSSEMLKLLLVLMPAQSIIAAISKYCKEKFGVTLPL